MTIVLEAQNLVRHFPVSTGLFKPKKTLKAVDGVSFTLEAGKTLGVVGESGCGKSTTANLAIGLTPPSAGTVLYRGKPLALSDRAEWRSQRRKLQMVFQDPMSALDRRLSLGEQVSEPLVIHRVGDRKTQRDRVLALFEDVGLTPHFYDRYPHEVSGGQRQRVVLARALILDPEVLVCDEPVSALDVSIQAQVLNLLEDMQRERGLSYLFISHDLKVIRQISDIVAVMYLGRIVEQGTVDRLYEAPEHPYTRALLAAIPSMRSRPGEKRTLLAGEPPSPIDVPSGCPFRTRCPWAQSLCTETTPALDPLPDGHRVACHVAHGRIAKPSGAM